MQQPILSQRAHRDSGAAFLGFLRGVFLFSMVCFMVDLAISLVRWLSPMGDALFSFVDNPLLLSLLGFGGSMYACWSGIWAGSRLVGPCPHCGCETHARGPQGSCETCRKTFRVVGTSFSPV